MKKPRWMNIRFFSRASIIAFLIFWLLVAIDKLFAPINPWLICLASFLAMPFSSVSYWIQSVRDSEFRQHSYFWMLVIMIISFIIYGWLATGQRYGVMVQLLGLFAQLWLASLIINGAWIKKFGRRLGGPPLSIVR